MVTGTTIPVKVNITRSYLNVLDNRGNGSNGGIWSITEKSTVNFLRNGDNGLSAATLSVNGSTLITNGNGADGIIVTGKSEAFDGNPPYLLIVKSFDAIDSKIEVIGNRVRLGSQYTTPGALFLRGGPNTVVNSTLILKDNQGPALHLYSGSLAMDEATKLTITGNRAYREFPNLQNTLLYQRGAGVFINGQGTATLPTSAVIYNNRAALEADDIYVMMNASIQFGPAFKGVLNEALQGSIPESHPFPSADHVIDGWYQDQVGAANRWIAHAVLPAVNHIDEFAGFGALVPGPLTLKAAHTLIEVSVKKTWVDGGSLARPDVVISLLADGEPATDANGAPVSPVTLKSPKVDYVFGNLIKYNSDLTEIVYTASEAPVAGYSTVAEGMNVRNTYIVPLIDVIATKTWSGGPEADHTAPKFILVRDGVDQPDLPAILPATGTATNFTYTWKDLPATATDGKVFVYTVREDGVINDKLLVNSHTYAVTQEVVNGVTNITNTYVVPFIDVIATKTWSGGPEADHTAVTLTLLRDGAALDPQPAPVITGTAPAFTYTWKDLPATDVNGVSYAYTVAEAGVVNGQIVKNGNRYTVSQTGNAITNTFIPPAPTPTPEPPPPTYPTITVPLQAQKILRNGTLKAGQFTFELRDKPGKLLAQVTNAADGSVVFPDRTFSREVSNYIYTIRETAGSDKTISYDSTVYIVKITTTAADGKLRAAVSLEKDGVPYAGKIVFTNTRELPKTGDNYLGTASLMAIVSMLMGVAWLLGGKRGRLNGKKSDMQ